MRPLAFASLALIATASTASAQLLQPGSRIRVTTSTPAADTRIGTVISSNADSVVIASDRKGEPARYARDELRSIEVSVARHRQPLRGAIIGTLAGVGSGAVIGAVTWAPCHGWCFLQPETRAGNAAFGAAAFGSLGFLIGTIAGTLVKSDTWQRVATEPAVAISPSGHGGAAIRFSRSF